MRVLVTGGLGFLGHAVTLDLVAHGHEVAVLTRGRPDARPAAGGLLVEGDIRDRDRVREIIMGGRFEAVCHLAALARARDSFADPLTYFDVNVGGTLNLLLALDETARGSAPARLVFTSTNIVYGSRHGGVALTEDTPPHPESPYAASKAAAEQLVTAYAATGAIEAVILRPFNISGAVDGVTDTDPGRIIPSVMRVVTGERSHITLHGDGSAVRDFVHVSDVADAVRLSISVTRPGEAATPAKAATPEEATTPGEATTPEEATTAGEAARPGNPAVYNIGSGIGSSVAQVVATAETVTGRTVPVKRLPPRVEPHTLVADNRLARRELGWKPRRSELPQIIRDAWDAWAHD